MAGGALLAALILVVVLLSNQSSEVATASPATSIVVGTPGGAVLSQVSPSATATSAPTPAPITTPEPATTAAPTPVESASVTPTQAPTPRPPTPQPTTPEPTAVIVALAQPSDTVAAFYRHAAEGDFDAAYALWSDRMQATYPREGNLDGRFAETASITFDQLSVAEQTDRSATVQANFTETYDSGSSRQFIGYWRLVQVDGRWLLDEPHY